MPAGKVRYIIVITNPKRKRADVIEFWDTRAFREWCFANVLQQLERSPFQGVLHNGDWFVAVKGRGAEITREGGVKLR